MTVVGRPKGKAFVFVTLLLLYFSDVGLLILRCAASLSECAAKEAAYIKQTPKQPYIKQVQLLRLFLIYAHKQKLYIEIKNSST